MAALRWRSRFTRLGSAPSIPRYCCMVAMVGVTSRYAFSDSIQWQWRDSNGMGNYLAEHNWTLIVITRSEQIKSLTTGC
jgi:hypothetical protein